MLASFYILVASVVVLASVAARAVVAYVLSIVVTVGVFVVAMNVAF